MPAALGPLTVAVKGTAWGCGSTPNAPRVACWQTLATPGGGPSGPLARMTLTNQSTGGSCSPGGSRRQRSIGRIRHPMLHRNRRAGCGESRTPSSERAHQTPSGYGGLLYRHAPFPRLPLDLGYPPRVGLAVDRDHPVGARERVLAVGPAHRNPHAPAGLEAARLDTSERGSRLPGQLVHDELRERCAGKSGPKRW